MVPCGTPVLPYLYLGGGSDASDPERLKSLNIYYVLNVTTDLPGDGESDSIRYKRIPAIDNFEQNLIQYFEECFQFIEEARKAGRSVLIHCQAGISRSPTIVIAYLMYSQKMSFNNAYSFVRSKREKINPNLSFVGQLCEYGDFIENLKNTLPTSTTSSPTSNESITSISKPITNPILITSTSSSNSTTVSQCNTAIINSPFNLTNVSTKLTSSTSTESHVTSTTTTITTTSISAPTTPTSPKPLTPPMPTTPIVTTLPITTIPTSRSYIKISDSVKKPFFLLPPPPPRPSNLSIKDGINKPDFPSSCEALSDIPYNSLGPVRGCRSRKSCTNDFILLRPIKMTKNARVK